MDIGLTREKFEVLPWTGVSENALGTPWTVDFVTGPAGAPLNVIIRNCYRAEISRTPTQSQKTERATAKRMVSVIAATRFATEVVNACDAARKVVAPSHRTSWDYTLVPDITRVFDTAQTLASLPSALRENPASEAVLLAWWRKLSEPVKEGFRNLDNLSYARDAIGKEAARLTTDVYLFPDDKFVFKIMSAFRSHVATNGSPTRSLQGRPLITPYRSDDPAVVEKFKNASDDFKRVREEASSELSAIFAAWDAVIIPSMNAFLLLMKNGKGSPKYFPTVVASLQMVAPDVGVLAQALRSVEPHASALLQASEQNIAAIRKRFAHKIDGNVELLAMDSLRRHEIFQTFGAQARNPARSKAHATSKGGESKRRTKPPVPLGRTTGLDPTTDEAKDPRVVACDMFLKTLNEQLAQKQIFSGRLREKLAKFKRDIEYESALLLSSPRTNDANWRMAELLLQSLERAHRAVQLWCLSSKGQDLVAARLRYTGDVAEQIFSTRKAYAARFSHEVSPALPLEGGGQPAGDRDLAGVTANTSTLNIPKTGPARGKIAEQLTLRLHALVQ